MARIQVAEVAGMQPAIFDGLSRSVSTVVITFHHNITGNGNLTCLLLVSFGKLRVN